MNIDVSIKKIAAVNTMHSRSVTPLKERYVSMIQPMH